MGNKVTMCSVLTGHDRGNQQLAVYGVSFPSNDLRPWSQYPQATFIVGYRRKHTLPRTEVLHLSRLVDLVTSELSLLSS